MNNLETTVLETRTKAEQLQVRIVHAKGLHEELLNLARQSTSELEAVSNQTFSSQTELILEVNRLIVESDETEVRLESQLDAMLAHLQEASGVIEAEGAHLSEEMNSCSDVTQVGYARLSEIADRFDGDASVAEASITTARSETVASLEKLVASLGDCKSGIEAGVETLSTQIGNVTTWMDADCSDSLQEVITNLATGIESLTKAIDEKLTQKIEDVDNDFQDMLEEAVGFISDEMMKAVDLVHDLTNEISSIVDAIDSSSEDVIQTSEAVFGAMELTSGTLRDVIKIMKDIEDIFARF